MRRCICGMILLCAMSTQPSCSLLRQQEVALDDATVQEIFAKFGSISEANKQQVMNFVSTKLDSQVADIKVEGNKTRAILEPAVKEAFDRSAPAVLEGAMKNPTPLGALFGALLGLGTAWKVLNNRANMPTASAAPAPAPPPVK
jgi:hypothetical protein